jgi:hypothetical protein
MTVLKDNVGPDFPLGLIVVPVPGTPVDITSLIDPTGKNNPNASNLTGTVYEYGTTRFHQFLLQGFKSAGAGLGLIPNVGNVYIVRQGGDHTDYGTIVAVIAKGETTFISAAPVVKNVFSPYRYLVDSDVANDALLITGFAY